MNSKVAKLIIYVNLILLGWILGFLRIPYADINQSFTVGLVAGFLIICLLLLTAVLTKSNWLSSFFDSKLYFSLLIVFVMLGGVYICLHMQGNYYNSFVKNKDVQIQSLKDQIRSDRNRNAFLEINHLINQFKMALAENNSLRSDSLSKQVVDFTFLLTRTHFIGKDSIDSDLAKGYLMEKLLNMPLDSTTWVSMISNCDFSYADLRGLHFKGREIMNGHFSYCDLREANMEGVSLTGTTFKRSQMEGLNLKDANISRSNMSSVILSYADLSRVKMQDVNLSWSSLRASDLRSIYAKNCDLQGVDLMHVQWQEGRFNDVNFKGAYVEDDWFDILRKANVRGLEQLDSLYKLRLQDHKPQIDAKYTLVNK